MSRQRRRDDPPPEFFLDRSLGRYIVADALREVGLTVHPLFEVYGDDEESVADEVWIREATEQGWPLLMKDDAIRLKDVEQAAILEAGARAFVVTNANLSGPTLAEHFVFNRHRIIQRCRRDGPYIVGVYLTAPHLRTLFP